MKYWPFKVVNDSSKPKVEVEYKGEIKNFYPEEISSMVLTKMKEISEAYLGKVDDIKRIILCSKWQRIVKFFADTRVAMTSCSKKQYLIFTPECLEEKNIIWNSSEL